MLVRASGFRRLLCVLSLSAVRQPPFPLLPSNTCYEGVLGLGEGLLWRRLGKGASNRCAGEKSRDNPLFQRLILQIEITPPSEKLRKVTAKPHSSVCRLYRENRPADQIADMRDPSGVFGPNLFSVREVKVFSDENEDLKLMK